MIPWVRDGSHGFFWVIQSFISCSDIQSSPTHLGQRLGEWGASLRSLWHPWPHTGWCPLHCGCSASAPGMLLLAAPQVWGWYDWLCSLSLAWGQGSSLVTGPLEVGCNLASEPLAPTWGFLPSWSTYSCFCCSPHPASRNLWTLCIVWAPRAAPEGELRLFLSVWWPHMPRRPVSPTFTNRSKAVQLFQQICLPSGACKPRGGGRSWVLPLLPPFSFPNPFTSSFHTLPPFHPSTSFLTLLPYTKPKTKLPDQVLPMLIGQIGI